MSYFERIIKRAIEIKLLPEAKVKEDFGQLPEAATFQRGERNSDNSYTLYFVVEEATEQLER